MIHGPVMLHLRKPMDLVRCVGSECCWLVVFNSWMFLLAVACHFDGSCMSFWKDERWLKHSHSPSWVGKKTCCNLWVWWKGQLDWCCTAVVGDVWGKTPPKKHVFIQQDELGFAWVYHGFMLGILWGYVGCHFWLSFLKNTSIEAVQTVTQWYISPFQAVGSFMLKLFFLSIFTPKWFLAKL